MIIFTIESLWRVAFMARLSDVTGSNIRKAVVFHLDKTKRASRPPQGNMREEDDKED